MTAIEAVRTHLPHIHGTVYQSHRDTKKYMMIPKISNILKTLLAIVLLFCRNKAINYSSRVPQKLEVLRDARVLAANQDEPKI